MCREAATPARPGQERAAFKLGPVRVFLVYALLTVLRPTSTGQPWGARGAEHPQFVRRDKARPFNARLCVAVGVSLSYDWNWIPFGRKQFLCIIEMIFTM